MIHVLGICRKVVSMEEHAALAEIRFNGFRCRVAKRGDEYFILTMDHDMKRINLWVSDEGKVTRAYLG